MSTSTETKIIMFPVNSRRKSVPHKKNYRLYECNNTRACGNLWVSKKEPFGEACVLCGNLIPSIIENFVHPDLKFKKMKAITFAKTGFYNGQNSSYFNYEKDSLLHVLEANGFKCIKSSHNTITLKNDIYEHVVFTFSKKNKNSTVYIGLHDCADPLFKQIIDCIKKDKQNKKNKEHSLELSKTKIISMPDALGKEVKVGDWVCMWTTNRLSFGKVITIEKFKKGPLGFEQDMIVGAKIKKGSFTSFYKTSDQIFLLTPEQALVLALEQ